MRTLAEINKERTQPRVWYNFYRKRKGHKNENLSC